MNWNRRSIAAALGVVVGGTLLGRNYTSAGVVPSGGQVAQTSVPEAPDSIYRVYDTKLTSVLQRNRGSAQARMEGYIPNVELVTENNKRVRFYDDLVKGKVVMINFIFTSCGGVCPLATVNLAKIQNGFGDRLGREVFMYSITLDPDTDTPEVLKRYATGFGAKPGWSFLTGNFDDIELLRYRLGIYDPDPVIDADKTQHGGLVVYGNEASGKWSAIPGMLKPSEFVRAVLRVV
jgi:protein SCO1/2